MTPDTLREFLEVLEDAGARSFSCPLFSVTLGEPWVEQDDDDSDIKKAVAKKAEREAPKRGNYSHRSLWPDGEPPTFPGDKRERTSPYREG